MFVSRENRVFDFTKRAMTVRSRSVYVCVCIYAGMVNGECALWWEKDRTFDFGAERRRKKGRDSCQGHLLSTLPDACNYACGWHTHT